MEIPTIGDLFLKRIKENPNKKAVGTIHGKKIRFLTYKEYFEKVEKIVHALDQLNINKQAKASILGTTSLEWHLADLAILCSQFVTVPIYPTYTPEDVFYILNHAESEVLFIDNSLSLKKITAIFKDLKKLKYIILFSSDFSNQDWPHENIQVLNLDELIDSSNPSQGFLEEKISHMPNAELASLIYTSGTTGQPKGAMITQSALSQSLKNIHGLFDGVFGESDRTLTWLPLSHVFGRFESLLCITMNWEMVFAESIENLIPNISLAKPTVMVAVPRIFEKIYAKISQQINDSGLLKKHLFGWASKISENFFETIQKDVSPGAGSFLLRKTLYKLIFSKIYERFGGRIRFFISGGAPLDPVIIKFLRNCNLTVLEGYGLTETIAASFINPPSKQIPGTVGLPIGDVQVKLADDNEILIKSRTLFSGYYKNPEETAKAMDGDWFKTGDIGMINSQGYLKITDRKKDIIVTAGGKNIAPQKIENQVKNQKYIAQCMVIGDKKKYLTALIGLEKEDFQGEEEAFGLEPGFTYSDLVQNKAVHEKIKEELSEVNTRLGSFESVKQFRIPDKEFTVENGLLTPSLKVKKKVLLEKYKADIDSMY